MLDDQQSWTPEPPPQPWERRAGVEYSDVAVYVNGELQYLTVAEADDRRGTLAERRDQLKSSAMAEYERRVAAGYLVDGFIIPIDAGSRADLGGMALTATLAKMNVQPWPEGMARGWISVGGDRLPLPTPDDGLALAVGAAGYYSALAQHEQDLEDAAARANTHAKMDLVDVTAGWPG